MRDISARSEAYLQKESFARSYANMDQTSFVKYVIYL